jgi:hypothetical protein
VQEVRGLAVQELRLHGDPLEQMPRLRAAQPLTTRRA